MRYYETYIFLQTGICLGLLAENYYPRQSYPFDFYLTLLDL